VEAAVFEAARRVSQSPTGHPCALAHVRVADGSSPLQTCSCPPLQDSLQVRWGQYFDVSDSGV
jgi:hypothetical protein